MDSADKWICPFAFKLRVHIDNKLNIPPLAFNCSLFICKFSNKQKCGIHLQFAETTYNLRNPLAFADSAYKFCGFNVHLRIPLTICGIHLQLRNPDKLAIFACCGIRKKNKGADKTYATGICMRNPLKFCLWNPLTFWNIFKTCLWNPETYRHKIVLPSNAQFGLVMALSDCHERKRADNSDSSELQRSYR